MIIFLWINSSIFGECVINGGFSDLFKPSDDGKVFNDRLRVLLKMKLYEPKGYV